MPSAFRVSRSSSDSGRPARRPSSRREIVSGSSGIHGASSVRCSAMVSGVASRGMRATYLSIADSVKPCAWSSLTSSSRAMWSGE